MTIKHLIIALFVGLYENVSLLLTPWVYRLSRIFPKKKVFLLNHALLTLKANLQITSLKLIVVLELRQFLIFFLFLFVFLLFCCLSYDPLIIWIVCFACLYFILLYKTCMFMIDAIYLIFFPPGKLKSHFREGYNVVVASGYGLLGWRGFDSYE